MNRQLELRGIRIGYSDDGEGPLAVYAHGMTASRANDVPGGLIDFRPVVEVGFRLVRYDARGHGETTGTSHPVDYHWPNLAQDLLALADALSPDAPIIGLGCSMGTGTLLHAALQAPERFRALVLTAPPTAWQTRAAQTDVYTRMADLVEAGDFAGLAELAGQQAEPAIFAGLFEEPPLPDVALELFPSVLRGAAGTDLPDPDRLSEITQPTLLLPWATDPGHPVSTAEVLADRMPNAELQVAETAADIATFGRRSADFLRDRLL